MKTYPCFAVAAWAILLATTAWAEPPDGTPPAPKPRTTAEAEPKLEGDELARFYLQEILEQAENEPIEVEHHDLMEELKRLVDRMALEHQQRLERRKAIVEQRAAELQAEAERRAAELEPAPLQQEKQPTAPPCAPVNMEEHPTAGCHDIPEAPPEACEPTPVRKTSPDVEGSADPIEPQEDEQRGAIALRKPSGVVPDTDTSVRVPEQPEDHVRNLIAMLDRVIVGLQTVRTWLATVSMS